MKEQHHRPAPATPLHQPPTTLEEMLAYLSLPATLENHPQIIRQAAQDNISHEEFLKRLFSIEAAAKFQRQVKNRLVSARFPFVKTLEEFDWAHPSSIPKAKVLSAMDLKFLDRYEGLVFMASHGLGKTHLAIAVGHRAAQAGVKTLFTKAVDMVNHLSAAQADHSLTKTIRLYTSPTLLIIDELGRLSLDQKQGEHIFNVIDARYERASTIITTNRAFRDWGKIFQDNICAKGIIDRLVHHSEVIKIEGESYRIKHRKTLSLAETE